MPEWAEALGYADYTRKVVWIARPLLAQSGLPGTSTAGAGISDTDTAINEMAGGVHTWFEGQPHSMGMGGSVSNGAGAALQALKVCKRSGVSQGRNAERYSYRNWYRNLHSPIRKGSSDEIMVLILRSVMENGICVIV